MQGVQSPFISNVINCYLSHRTAILKAKELNWPHVTIFEDDAYPRNGVYDELGAALKEIPEGKCKVFLMGYSYVDEILSEKTGVRLFGRFRGYGSNAYVVFKEAYDDYLKVLDSVKISDGPFQISLTGHAMSEDDFYGMRIPLFIQYNGGKSMNTKGGLCWIERAEKTYDERGEPLMKLIKRSDEDILKHGFPRPEDVLK